MKKKFDYNENDAGCYVDGARGIYAIDLIVQIAEEHGFIPVECTDSHAETSIESRFAGCEFAAELEEEASTYMNEVAGVEDFYWGNNENGDWGLWSEEEEGNDQHQ